MQTVAHHRQTHAALCKGLHSPPQVEDLRLVALGHKNIAGLDVTMNDSLAVRRVERVGNFDREVEESIQFEWPARDVVVERNALDQFHHNESPP